MFRTVFVRGVAIRRSLQKQVFINGIRTLMLQTYRRKLIHTAPYVNQSQQWHLREQGVRHYSSELPQHTKVVLPALSPTMEEGTLISWAKKEGDKLNEGDLLAEIETDKATMAFETPEEGFLAKILVPAGSKGVPIGKLVCIIVENEADVAAFKDFKDDSPAPAKAPGGPSESAVPSPAPQPPPLAATPPKQSAPPPAQPSSPPPPTSEPSAAQGTRVYASPMAKRLAEQRQIRLQGKGTGLFGSITSSDLDQMSSAGAQEHQESPAAAAAPQARAQVPQGAAYVDIPNSNMRSTIAKRLTQSKSSIPHFYVAAEVNLDTINKLRKKVNKQMEKEGVRLSVNDFIIKATAMANLQVPEANSYWMDTVIRQFSNVDVSVAVATDNGLITPIVFDANHKGLLAISKEVKSLAKKAREGKLQPAEYQGGTVTVSNLGMFDVKFFTAIINPPQSVILAVGSGKEKLVADENSPNGFRSTTTMMVTVSCDHRVVDGVVAARWLKAFRQFIEDPITMVL